MGSGAPDDGVQAGASLATAAIGRAPALPAVTRGRDSGSHSHRSGAISSGTTPPTTNTAGQPNRWTTRLATTPPSAPPIEKPLTATVTMVERRRVGAYSET